MFSNDVNCLLDKEKKKYQIKVLQLRRHVLTSYGQKKKN